MLKKSVNKSACRMHRRLTQVLLLSLMAAGHASATIPVVDSTAAVTAPEVRGNAPAVAGAPAGSAYLLNVIEQLRQEVMDLRGMVEEQGFLIKQLRQENRDRYLDLDERVARLSGATDRGRAAPAVPLGQPSAPVSVTPATGAEEVLASSERLESAAYTKAFQLIGEKRFDQALAALKQLLVDFPSGRYADNAQYWLGEVYMAQGDYSAAQAAFSLVLSGYPQSPKIPDATYKLGRLYDLLGNRQQAREYLEQVINRYPDTAASRLSDTYLRNLDEG